MLANAGSCPASNDSLPFGGADALSTPTPVVFADGRLSVSARDLSIVQLMRLVGAEAGFDVVAYGDLETQTGSWSFSGLTLNAAIKKLLRDTNSIVSYRPGGEAGAEAEISTVYLLGSNSVNENAIRIETVEPGLDNQLRMDQVQSGEVQERLAAIDRSAGLADDITLQDLAFAMQHDPDPEVRTRAIAALESIGGEAVVTALEGALGDTDAGVRIRLIQALANIDDERIPLLLGQLLMGDPEPEVRLEALRAVARKQGDVARMFVDAAAGDSSSLVSDAALGLTRPEGQ